MALIVAFSHETESFHLSVFDSVQHSFIIGHHKVHPVCTKCSILETFETTEWRVLVLCLCLFPAGLLLPPGVLPPPPRLVPATHGKRLRSVVHHVFV